MALSNQTRTDVEPPSVTIEDALSTGFDLLDVHLDGGWYPGTIVAVVADPASQSEVLLTHLAANRNTLYLSLQRTPDTVRASLERSGVDVDTVAVRQIGTQHPLEDMYALVEQIDEPANVVIDPMNLLERYDPSRLAAFLNAVQTHLRETGGLLLLHCLTGDARPPARDTTEYLADVIFQLETDYLGETVDNRLLVPKVRGGKPFPHEIKLHLTNRVAIDTSREIA